MRLVLAITLVSVTAFADPAATPKAPDAKQMHADDCAKARAAGRTCVLDMGPETVNGTTIVPNGLVTSVIKLPPNGSLIHIRTEFIEQILKTAEDL
jgi:hypothetical protein